MAKLQASLLLALLCAIATFVKAVDDDIDISDAPFSDAPYAAPPLAPNPYPYEAIPGPEIELYEFTPEEAPGSPVSICLDKLTYDCADQINTAIIGKVLNVTKPCCATAISLGKTCWSYVLNEPMDDPCHFFHYVIAYCFKSTRTMDEALFNFHSEHKACMGKEEFETLNVEDVIFGDKVDEKPSDQMLQVSN